MNNNDIQSWDWSFVDTIVYINLDVRKDRDAQLRDNFKLIGIPEEKYHRFAAISHEVGQYGCVLSHIAVLNEAKNNGWRNILIIEDDMVFNNAPEDPERWLAFINHLTQQASWDVAMLSGNHYILNTITPGFTRTKFSYCSNCYMVNAYYYDRLIENLNETKENLEKDLTNKKLHLDANWIKIMEKDNWFAIYPCLGYQSNGFSDIESRNIDHTGTFTRKIDDIKIYGSY